MSDSTDINAKITLVRRMLAKAESTTPEEAEALTAAAEKIMLRLGIDDAMVDASSDEPVQKNTRVDVTFTGRYAMAELLLAYSALQAMNTCYCLRGQGRNTETLRIYGRESQVERAAVLARSLAIQANVAMRAWWKENRSNYLFLSEHRQFMERRQFMVSFGKGAASRIREEMKVATQETPGSALVIASEARQAEDYAKSQVGRIGKSRGITRGGGNGASHSGYSSGRRANVGTTAVSGGSGRAITA